MGQQSAPAFEPHAFTSKIASWMYCRKCGLIRLRNPLTDWCVSKGCNYDEHPQYRAKVRQYTSPAWLKG